MTLTADRRTLDLADRLRVLVSVEAPPDMVVTFPEVPAQLGPFMVYQHRTREPQAIAADRRRWQQDYVLEANTVGDLTLPPLSVSFRPAGAAADSPAQALQTAPLTISVTAHVPQNADVKAPRDIAPPVALSPHSAPAWLGLVVGAVAVLGLSMAAWKYWQHRQAARTRAPQPAHLLALAALQRLQRDDLIGQQCIEAFYVRLSDIVRQYVEWRFGLHAAEQTTEEFLAAVMTSGGLIAAPRDLLVTFLDHCDLVKFARHRPTPDDMQQALSRARLFIEQTADAQILVAAPPAGVSA
jgi:hypothetical protein